VESFTRLDRPELTAHVAAVKAGSFHTLAPTTESTLYAFGPGREGQLGSGRAANGANAVSTLTNVVSFAAGTWHSVAVQRDGSVWAWGSNVKSQLCDGTTRDRLEPARIALPDEQMRVVRVAAGGHGRC
jgi:alpha-tubulin suppressor-like RCC1 family protein